MSAPRVTLLAAVATAISAAFSMVEYVPMFYQWMLHPFGVGMGWWVVLRLISFARDAAVAWFFWALYRDHHVSSGSAALHKPAGAAAGLCAIGIAWNLLHRFDAGSMPADLPFLMWATSALLYEFVLLVFFVLLRRLPLPHFELRVLSSILAGLALWGVIGIAWAFLVNPGERPMPSLWFLPEQLVWKWISTALVLGMQLFETCAVGSFFLCFARRRGTALPGCVGSFQDCA